MNSNTFFYSRLVLSSRSVSSCNSSSSVYLRKISLKHLFVAGWEEFFWRVDRSDASTYLCVKALISRTRFDLESESGSRDID